MTPHTKTPWRITQATNGDIYIGSDEWVLKMVDKVDFTVLPKEANAAFIVRACNAHEDMLKVLQSLRHKARLNAADRANIGWAVAKSEGTHE